MPDTIEQDFIEEHWPTLSEMTYLNNASTGIMPTKTTEAMKEYLDNRSRAIGSFEETIKKFKDVREGLATLLGGNEKQYAFVPNTSEGLNTFGHGIEYPTESNIVVCDLEFPANYVPWQNIAKLYDVELRVAKSTNGGVDIEQFLDNIDEDTKVVAVSLVQFGSGFRIDLEPLAKAVHEVGGYLVVDIIQAAGWLDIDLHKMDVDFAAAQAAKWLVGPIGAGFVYIKNEIVQDVHPRYLGWWGIKDLMKFAYTEREPLDDAKRFQVGSPAMVAYVGLLESLKILTGLNPKVREEVALSNGDYLRKRLEELDIDFFEFDKKNQSPIVSCAPDNLEELQKRLQKEKIHCSVRNGRLRVSPHFYNTREEIDRLVEYLR